MEKERRQEIMHSFYRAIDNRPQEFLDILCEIIDKIENLMPTKDAMD